MLVYPPLVHARCDITEMWETAVFNVCPSGAAWGPAKPVEPVDGGGTEAVAICRDCGARIPFRRLPLFVVTGPSSAGKSALAMALPRLLPECVILDNDILWGAVSASPDDDYRSYHEVWLRLVKNIHQSGRPVVLCGTILPEHLETSLERRYIGPTHYLALVCEDAVLIERLRARPTWRGAGGNAFLARMVAFNTWLHAHAAETAPPITLLDTSGVPLDTTAREVAGWACRHRGQRTT